MTNLVNSAIILDAIIVLTQTVNTINEDVISVKIDKFMKLEEEKKDRILSAAMQEFRYGYKKASTDAIAKIACVSKGSLFHYFGTKEQFYIFLIQRTMDILEEDYFKLLDLKNGDILDGLWQEALAKHNITVRFPYIYRFFTSIQLHLSDFPNEELARVYSERQKKQFEAFYNDYDASLFREDVEPEKAVNLIIWAVEGFYNESQVCSNENDEDYDMFLDSLRVHLDILKTCFYK